MDRYEPTIAQIPTRFLLDFSLCVSSFDQRSRRNVGPIPMSSIEQKSIDCADANAEAFASLLRRLIPVQKPSEATPQSEINETAMEICGISDKEVGLYLSGKGFVKIRRKRGFDNVNLYQYRFENEGELSKLISLLRQQNAVYRGLLIYSVYSGSSRVSYVQFQCFIVYFSYTSEKK